MKVYSLFLGSLATALLLWGAGCRSTPAIPPENARRIKRYWALYLRRSPEWEKARAEWTAMGAAERRALADLLILDVKNRTGLTELDALGKPHAAWIRPVKELERLGEDAREPLLQALRRVRDEASVPAYAEALASVSRFQDLSPFFEKKKGGETGRFQSRLILALAHLQDPRAVDLLVSVARDPAYDWRVRARASEMLGRTGKEDRRKVIAALNAALEKEKDGFVAQKMKEALKALQRSEGGRR